MTPKTIKQIMYGLDSSGDLKEVQVNSNGQIIPQSVLPGVTHVREGVSNVIPSLTTGAVNWNIPNGKVFSLSRFRFGGYIPGDYNISSKAELYWQPNGSSTGEELVVTLYLQHQSDTYCDFTDLSYIGDGVSRMRLVVTNSSAQQMEASAIIEGYY